MPSINEKILTWARETAGLSLSDAASRLGLRDTKSARGEDRLKSLESGVGDPDDSLLGKMAKIYRRPLLTFYLAAPPPADTSSHDFRTLPEQSTEDEPVISAVLRDVKTRQVLLRNFLEEEDHQAQDFVGSVPVDSNTADVAKAIVHKLDISAHKFRNYRTSELAFAYLRERVELAGIYVVLLGNLGSHHTNIDVRAFRGIALADTLAPFIVINDQDSKTAWSFTLLHEVCHIFLGQSGISGSSSERSIEKFCNDVATSILLPDDELQKFAGTIGQGRDETISAISLFAGPRHLSLSLVAYRLFRGGFISEAIWSDLAEHFRNEWRLAKEREKEDRKVAGKPGGPSYYVVRRQKLGRALIEATARGVTEGTLSPSKAGRILGVAPRSVYPLLYPANGRAA